MTIDASAMTFCDGTLADFLAQVSATTSVFLRRPSRLFADCIRLWGLSQLLAATIHA